MPMPIGTADPAELRGAVAVLTFDLYGTIVDMQAGLIDAVTSYLRAKGGPADPARW